MKLNSVIVRAYENYKHRARRGKECAGTAGSLGSRAPTLPTLCWTIAPKKKREAALHRLPMR